MQARINKTKRLGLPEFMTQTMSSMVTAVSAMLVAKMILRTPAGGRRKTLRWSCVGTMECRASSW